MWFNVVLIVQWQPHNGLNYSLQLKQNFWSLVNQITGLSLLIFLQPMISQKDSSDMIPDVLTRMILRKQFFKAGNILNAVRLRTTFLERISQCRRNISRWKRRNMLNAKEKIALIHHKLDCDISSSQGNLFERDRLRGELNQAYFDEEIVWKIKVESLGLTWKIAIPVFHNATNVRKQRNIINTITDVQGVVKSGNA